MDMTLYTASTLLIWPFAFVPTIGGTIIASLLIAALILKYGFQRSSEANKVFDISLTCLAITVVISAIGLLSIHSERNRQSDQPLANAIETHFGLSIPSENLRQITNRRYFPTIHITTPIRVWAGDEFVYVTRVDNHFRFFRHYNAGFEEILPKEAPPSVAYTKYYLHGTPPALEIMSGKPQAL